MHDRTKIRMMVVALVVGLLFSSLNILFALPSYPSFAPSAVTGGTTRVIVGLKVAFQPEGQLNSGQSISAQRASIQQAQSQLLATLPSYDPTTVVNLTTIPYIVLTVDDAGLQALQISNLVDSIQEDRQLELFLDNSTRLTGTDTAWNLGYDGTGQTVAIIDTGVDRYHWFFGGRVVAEGCFSTTGTVDGINYTTNCPNGQNQQTGPGSGINCDVALYEGCFHGTHVAGITAGHGTTFSGVARNANIIAVQITSTANSVNCGTPNNKCMQLLFSNVVEALEYVYSLRNDYNISSINMSLGTTAVYTSACDTDFPSMRDVINNLTAAKIAVVAASGNGDATGSGYTNGISSPACITNSISVGATSADPYSSDRFGGFSNSASFLKLLAPGVNIMSSIPDGAFESASGTSMAAPHVAGAWAVLKQALPTASVSTILTTLQNTGVPLTDPRNNVVTSRIQLDAAVASATGAVLPAPANDNFANLIPVTANYDAFSVTRTATNQAGLNLTALSGSCGGGNVDKDVWFSFHSGAAGSIILSTEGSSFDTLLAVWTNVPAAPNLVACQDNVWTKDPQSRLTLTTSANTTYYIQVGGRSNAVGLLRFQVYTSSNNDLIGNAKLISDVPYGDAQNTASTVQNQNDPIPTNCSLYLVDPTPWYTVWYRYVPSEDEKVVFDTFGSNYNTLLALWKGQPGNLTEVACHDDVVYDPFGTGTYNDCVSFIQTSLTKGQTYYLMAGGKDAFFSNLPNGELKVDVQRWYIDPTLATPNLTQPANGLGIVDTPPTLVWSAVPGAGGYELQLDTNTNMTTALIHVNGTNYHLGSLQAGTYYWRVRALNGLPTSAWSSVRQFSFSVSPDAPNEAPARNVFTTSTPILTWTPVSWAATYEVVVAQNPQFANPVYTNSNIDELSVMLDSLSPGSYYWRVRGKSADGKIGGWSNTDTFVIIAP